MYNYILLINVLQLMNFTSDNVSTNDKAMRDLAGITRERCVVLNAKEQRSQ